jgi:leader peptidase (prepilin peptidase)/N-methyltransferase
MDLQTGAMLLSPFVLALFGLCIGSFLNVVVHRLPQMMERGWRAESAELLGVTIEPPPPLTLSAPRSRCPSCGHQITWAENIPLVSYLVLRGRCSACKAPISLRYPLVEVATALLFAACGWHVGPRLQALLWCGFAATLLALALIDLDTQFLPDDLTLPLMWAGLVAAALGWLPITLSESVFGAAAGYLSLWLVSNAFRLIRGKEGMGAGDFKLLAALGAWLGWQVLPSVILLASAVGAVIGIGLIVFRRHDRDVPIPFGPYLAGGGIAALFFAAPLARLWMPAG